MLINLVPDFFTVLQSTDPVAAYQRYFETHRPLLEAYWHNYVLDPGGPHFLDVIREAVHADRADLRAMLDRVDIAALAKSTEEQCAALFELDSRIDVLLMVGVGGANAGELVVGGRGIAFACLEHFTGATNASTRGLGLEPELLPMWLSHEIAHAVRYTSPTSRSAMRQFIAEQGGYYSYWETGRHVQLREHLVNEGLAVQAARLLSPGHAAWEYFGFQRRQYVRTREMEPVLFHSVADELDSAALGLRLRWLSSGMSDDARTVDRYVIPERAGYFLGARLVEDALTEHGIAKCLRMSAQELLGLASEDTGVRTA